MSVVELVPRHTQEGGNPFVSDLQDAIHMLSQNGINFRVIGSLGLASQLSDYPFNPFKPNRTFNTPHTDIDILYANVSPRKASQAEDIIGRYNASHPNTYLDASLARDKWILFDQDAAFLSHYSYNVEIPSHTFSQITGRYLSVSFPTLPLQTQLHIMGVVGEFRSKDMPKIYAAARHVRDHPHPDLPEEDYVAYHEFYKGLRRKHPIYTWRHHQHNKRHDTFDADRQRTSPVRTAKSVIINMCYWLEGHRR